MVAFCQKQREDFSRFTIHSNNLHSHSNNLRYIPWNIVRMMRNAGSSESGWNTRCTSFACHSDANGNENEQDRRPKRSPLPFRSTASLGCNRVCNGKTHRCMAKDIYHGKSHGIWVLPYSGLSHSSMVKAMGIIKPYIHGFCHGPLLHGFCPLNQR